MKVCRICGLKPLSSFGKGKDKDGLRGECRVCRKAIYLNNKEIISIKNKAYYLLNKDKIKSKVRAYYKANSIKLINKDKEFYKENKKEILTYDKVYCKKRRHLDPKFRLVKNLRSRLSNILRNKLKSGSAIQDLGCSVEELKKYLEARFESGMTWDNYGKWHIDHIVPLSSFDLSNREALLKACHYTNLQPLWAIDNIRKSNKI